MLKVCRTKDLYLTSSFGRNSSGSSGGLKERPRLNLTVKKELQGLGGQIMAQSRMAKVRIRSLRKKFTHIFF